MFGLSRDERERALRRWERLGDLPLTLLALVLATLLLLPLVSSFPPAARGWMDGAAVGIWLVFAADLALRLALSTHRLAYLRRHWLSAVMVVVPMLRLAWAVVAAARGLAGLRRLLASHGFGYVLLAGMVLVFFAAVVVLEVERQSPTPGAIRTLEDALWWAMTTVTTVGYGDTYPTTTAGRAVGVGLMLLGIALFGVMTARLAALFVEESDSVVERQLRDLDRRMERMEALLAEIAVQRDGGAADASGPALPRAAPEGRAPGGHQPRRASVTGTTRRR